MRKLSILALMIWSAQGWAGQVFCSPGAGGVPVPTYSETIQISQSGMPGLVWVGATDSGQQWAEVLTLNNTWNSYNGGLYPPFARYDSGLPSSVNVLAPLPVTDGTTGSIVGWTIYVGFGMLSAQAQQEVQARRAFLNQNQAAMIANGTWNSAYASDDQEKWALAQQDLTQNQRYWVSTTVPYINCNPPTQGGGGAN